VRVGRKKRTRLEVEVFDAETGALKESFLSPFQKGPFKDIMVTVQDSNGGGIPDLVVVTARKGKRIVTATGPG
jgi:hypothetical protein